MAFSFGNSTNTSTTKPTLNFGGTSTTNTSGNTGNSMFLGLGAKQNNTLNTSTTQQPAKDNSSSSLFLGLGPKTTQSGTTPNLFSSTTSINQSQNNPSQQQQQSTQTNLNTSTLASGGPQIDIAHLRSTTKYDHLTPQLQQEILALDTAILNQIKQCTDVSDLLPAVTSSGGQIAPALDFVSSKLDELETGLENDAEAVVALRDGDLGLDESEAKCVFRTVDRLKIPRQYQVGSADVGAVPGAAFNGGLSGWWNQPQAFRGSSVRAAGAGLSVQLVEEDVDDGTSGGGGGGGGSGDGSKRQGPKNLVDLFNSRTTAMAETSAQHKRLLTEIEDFVGGLEEKVYLKERDLNERLDNGVQMDGEAGLVAERERQMQLLRFVFGEVQRNLYEVAEKIGGVRDGVVELGFRR